jgi:hypothetical protein
MMGRLNHRTLALPETANRQRATMQTRQGLDATHGGEVFPVDESCAVLMPLAGVCSKLRTNPGRTDG